MTAHNWDTGIAFASLMECESAGLKRWSTSPIACFSTLQPDTTNMLVALAHF
jgi:hypothetical protein